MNHEEQREMNRELMPSKTHTYRRINMAKPRDDDGLIVVGQAMEAEAGMKLRLNQSII